MSPRTGTRVCRRRRAGSHVALSGGAEDPPNHLPPWEPLRQVQCGSGRTGLLGGWGGLRLLSWPVPEACGGTDSSVRSAPQSTGPPLWQEQGHSPSWECVDEEEGPWVPSVSRIGRGWFRAPGWVGRGRGVGPGEAAQEGWGPSGSRCSPAGSGRCRWGGLVRGRRLWSRERRRSEGPRRPPRSEHAGSLGRGHWQASNGTALHTPHPTRGQVGTEEGAPRTSRRGAS